MAGVRAMIYESCAGVFNGCPRKGPSAQSAPMNLNSKPEDQTIPKDETVIEQREEYH